MKRQEMLGYMKKLSGSIGSALQREGLGGYLIRAKRGPLTLNYRFTLQDPNLANVKKALSIAPAVRQLTGVKSVRVYEGEVGIDVEFPSPDPKTPSAEELVTFMRGANVAVGLDKWGEPIYVNLKNNPNLLFIGPQGKGKSTAVKGILYGILKTTKTPVQFYIFSAKTEDWRELATREGCLGLYSDPASIDEKIQAIADNMQQIAANPEKVIPTFIVLDDFQNLLGACKHITIGLSTIVSMGRALRYCVFCLTQTAGSKDTSGGFKIEDLFDARVVYRTASKHGAARATGADSGAISDLTEEKGDAVLVKGGEITRIATGWIDDKAIKTLPQAKEAVKMHMPVRTIQGPTSKAPELPKVEPPDRVLNEDELTQVKVYLNWYKRKNGQYPSLRAVTIGVYGTKTPKTDRLTRDSLGENIVNTIKGAFGGGKEKHDR